MSGMPQQKERSRMWYLLPVFLLLMGGLIAAYVLKDTDRRKAKLCTLIGVTLTVGMTIFLQIVMYLDQISMPERMEGIWKVAGTLHILSGSVM